MNNNIVSIHSQKNLKFIVDVIKESSVNKRTGQTIINQKVVIKLKNLDNDRSRIHPYTEFVNQWANKSTKYKLNIAGNIVRFLNFIYFNLSNKVIDSIENLTFELGVEFINQRAQSCCQEVVNQYELILTHFYFFLAKKQILIHIKTTDFIWGESDKGLRIQSAFQGKSQNAIYSPSEKLHHLEWEVIFPFIQVALENEPDIALGIYFQFFGGLRLSEVLSIEYNDISLIGPNGENGMKIRLSKKDLRPDIKSGCINKTKKPRKQIIKSIHDVLPKLYKMHKKRFKRKGCSAVFIDKRGNTMTDVTYRRRFNRVKKLFIKKLSESENVEMKAYALTLQCYNWSTHIGRGVFSNISAEVASNAVELASVRGDKDLKSALPYITDTSKIANKMVEVMEGFYSKMEDMFDD